MRRLPDVLVDALLSGQISLMAGSIFCPPSSPLLPLVDVWRQEGEHQGGGDYEYYL